MPTGREGARFAELAARSCFSFLDGASHPEELAETAEALGPSGLGPCDLNGLAGAVRGRVAGKRTGLPFAVGCRLRLDSGSERLAWPTDRAGYGRLTALLSRGRVRAPKGECRLGRGHPFVRSAAHGIDHRPVRAAGRGAGVGSGREKGGAPRHGSGPA